MEDYKEKYEAVLNRVKDYFECKTKLYSNVDETLKYLFPELKESEDEMIRKALIKLVKKAGEGYENVTEGVSIQKAISWLEKQGNLIKWQTNSKDNKPEKNHSVLMQTTHGIAEGEWQGEHWYQYRWSVIVRDSNVLSWIELSEFEKQGEQKPAWSEEDELKWNTLIHVITNQKGSAIFEGLLQEELINWLKSIKDRMKGE